MRAGRLEWFGARVPLLNLKTAGIRIVAIPHYLGLAKLESVREAFFLREAVLRELGEQERAEDVDASVYGRLVFHQALREKKTPA